MRRDLDCDLSNLILHSYTCTYAGDPRKTQHLLALEGAKERLHLFKAELLEDGSFDSIVDGCRAVFHTASPVVFSASDPQVSAYFSSFHFALQMLLGRFGEIVLMISFILQAEIVDPAVRGTLNVLKSCAKVPSIKRVVVTSSMASVVCNGKPLTSDVVVDETWFSDPVFCEQSKVRYFS